MSELTQQQQTVKTHCTGTVNGVKESVHIISVKVLSTNGSGTMSNATVVLVGP